MGLVLLFLLVGVGVLALVASLVRPAAGDVTQRADPIDVAARTGAARRRRWPRILGGLLLAVVGVLTAFLSFGSWVIVCETDPVKDWYRLESPGGAVAVTSAVLEFESGTFGAFDLFCESERVLRVSASAQPVGRKPVFLGVGPVAAARRYLGAGRYEIAATDFSLDDVRRVGGPIRRLAPPAAESFWRSYAVFPGTGAGAPEPVAHRWRAVGVPFDDLTPPSERFWLVLMNADGSPGVAADLTYEVGLAPRTRWPWLIGVLAGLALVVYGIVVAVRRPRSRDRATRDGATGWRPRPARLR